MRELYVGIVGAGNIAHCHALAYQRLANVHIAAVCDIQEQRARDFAHKYKIPHVYNNHSTMIRDTKLDAVSVCAWNSVHASITIDFLNHGIHVLCEKPLAMNTAQALAMEAAAKAHGCILMPGFCTRYEEGIGLLLKQVKSGRLGEIYYVKTTYLRRRGYPGGWFGDSSRSGGGPVIDLGVHVLDLARFIAGGDVHSVVASTHKMPAKEGYKSHSPHISIEDGAIHDVEDFATALIRMNNGMIIQLETSWNHHIPEDVFQFEVYGTKGGAKAYPKLAIFEDEQEKTINRQIEHSNHEDQPNYDFDCEIRHFTEVLRGLEAPLCTASDGVEVMRMIDAIYESAATGTEVIVRR